ncbi:Ergothioneine biosynthesis protein 1 [Podosphaera aphanis]|nr:Ergothioneine biosynthesis protein 1 [Podosphaera aphanis]
MALPTIQCLEATVINPKLSKVNGNKTTSEYSNLSIFDIHGDAVKVDLKDEILKSLQPSNGVKTLPTMLLYNERGLQLFEKITYLDEYYLTNAEIEILRNFAHEIAATIPSGSMIVELGSGNLRKIKILLEALEDVGKDIDYYALDLSLEELHRTLAEVPRFKHIRCHGLYGSYDDGLHWLKLSENHLRPKCIISLGSSIGNFRRRDAEVFLNGFSENLRPTDLVFIGLDNTYDASRVYEAYNGKVWKFILMIEPCSPGSCTNRQRKYNPRVSLPYKSWNTPDNVRFILNGLQNANEVLGEEVFQLADWDVIGEYVYDEEGGRHQALLTPTRDFEYKNILFKSGERIEIERSLKYSDEEASRLWKGSGLKKLKRWSSPSEAYSLYCLVRNSTGFGMNLNPMVYAVSEIPTLEDWKTLWSFWEAVTRHMILETELIQKPIELRHPFIFYLGHIPTFLDLQVSKETGESLSQTTEFARIFERGIDPDVDNPNVCHSHSEIPDFWPPLAQILEYQDAVHDKIKRLYKMQEMPRNIARAIWIGFEHEAMHLETLLYMLIQSDKALPPPTGVTPNFEAEAIKARATRVPNQWFRIPKQNITVGLDDLEDNLSGHGPFGWDNEKPCRNFEVPSFEAQARPITNGEYAYYLLKTQSLKVPASWVVKQKNNYDGSGSFNMDGCMPPIKLSYEHNDQNLNSERKGYVSLPHEYLEGKFVRSVYGAVILQYALDWPVIASFNELSGYARWMNARIPTFEEVRSIYSYVDSTKMRATKQNEPTKNNINGDNKIHSIRLLDTKSILDHFLNLDEANVGFKNWHQVPVTSNGSCIASQAEMGGVWEWTSSVLEKYDGFEPMKNYPGYTADFFDGKHNIVLGGSWATHPRIAGRKSFVNWYQRNYEYAWIGARLVRDL